MEKSMRVRAQSAPSEAKHGRTAQESLSDTPAVVKHHHLSDWQWKPLLVFCKWLRRDQAEVAGAVLNR